MKTTNEDYKNKFISKNPTLLDTKLSSNKQVLTFYEHPTRGEDAPVYVLIGDVLADTEFFDLEDFYYGSDYEPVLGQGEIMCKFELDNIKQIIK